jgi:hypothetical protein
VERGPIEMMGTEYQIGDYATIFLQLKDSEGMPVNNGNCYVDIYYPSYSNFSHPILYSNIGMIYKNESDGIYFFDLIVPNITGVYMLGASCAYSFDTNWIYAPLELVQKPKRTAINGTWTGDTLWLNTYVDGLYEKCVAILSGGNRVCEAYYDFNSSWVENFTKLDLYYAGESDSTPTATFYVWNWTSSSWVTLTNTLVFSSTASASSPPAPLSLDEFVTNSISLNGTINDTTKMIRIRMRTVGGSLFNLYNNWLALKFMTAEGDVQDLKGSGELHVTNYSANINSSISNIWNYPNRTLTDYNQSGILSYLNLINSTINLQYSSLYSLIVSVNSSINVNINAVNSSICGKLFTIQIDLQNIQNNLTLVYNLIGSVNTTIMNKLYAIQNEITSVNNTIKDMNASIHSRLESIDVKLDSIQSNITEIRTMVYEINSTTHQIVGMIDNLSVKIDDLNSSLVSYISTSFANLEYNITNLIVSVNNTVISANGTIMNKLYGIQDEIASLNQTIINAFMNISNLTINITTSQDEIMGAMLAFGGDTAMKRNYAYIGMLPLVGLGEENALWSCKDNITLVKYVTKYIGGSLNKTYVMTDEQICTYGCIKNACVLPAYQIWIYVFIGLIAIFLLYLYFSRMSEAGESIF